MSDQETENRNQESHGRNCVVVLGMHRSGTSAITRYLIDLGFEVPGPSLPAHPIDNPDGYSEPRDLMLSNNRFLEKIGEGWKGIRPIRAAEFGRSPANTARDEVQKILEKALTHRSDLVLKDPRLCRMAPVYAPILRQLFERVCVVQVIREPESVFESLAYRAKIPDIKNGAITCRSHAHFLWLRYNLDAEAWSSTLPTLKINYETWVNSPEENSQKLRGWLQQHLAGVQLKDIVPTIKSPRSLPSAPSRRGRCEAAQITQYYFQTSISLNHDLWNDSGINEAFATPIPAFHQRETDKPSDDLVAAAYSKHITGKCDFISLASTLPAEKLVSEPIIVFISDRPNIPCHIYRVKNMVDALNKDGINAMWVTSSSAAEDLRIIEGAKLVIVHRSFWSDTLKTIFGFCSQRKIPIASDIDDFIFDESMIDSGQIDFMSKLPESAINEWKDKARKFRSTLLAADLCTTSTPLIRDHLISLGKRAICIPNGFSVENAELSAHWRNTFSRQNDTKRICYASGSMTHNEDFGIIVQPISTFLHRHPDWKLTVIGQLHLDRFMEYFNEEQIEVRPLVAHINLAYEIARADINVIPLTRNQFNDAKSPLKWYESALCGVPSIATSNPMYRELFSNGGGMLAANAKEWLTHLNTLAESPNLREQISETARWQADELFGPAATSSQWCKLLNEIEE